MDRNTIPNINTASFAFEISKLLCNANDSLINLSAETRNVDISYHCCMIVAGAIVALA